MKSKTKIKVLLVILIIPTVVLISSATLNIIWMNDMFLSNVQTGGVSGPGYSYNYYSSSSGNFFSIEYKFDNVWFTHQNEATIIWNTYNATHYYLNFTLDYTRNPGNYILIFESNNFDVNGTVTVQGNTYYLNAKGVSTSNSVFIAYIQIPALQKISATINVNVNNTHNSDNGNVFASGSTTFQSTILDPTTYMTPWLISIVILVISIISLIVIGIITIIIWRRRNNFDYY